MPASGHFLNISTRVPIEGGPPGHLQGPSSEREKLHLRPPFIHLSKSPVDEFSSRFPKRGPYGKRCPSPEPFRSILQGPLQGSPSSTFPSQSFNRERHSTPRAPFKQFSLSPVEEPTPGYPPEQRRDAHPQSLPFITCRNSSKEAPPSRFPKRTPIERDAPFPEPPFN